MSANPKAKGEHLPKREKGIILRVEDDYKLCVWSPKDPMTEIRFIRQDEDFKPGDFVSFTQNNLTDGVYLDPLQFEALPNSFEVIQNPPPLPIQLMVEVAIPPRDCGYYNREEIEALEYGVSFYCYSIEFGKIASFAPLLQEPGKVYKARIGRVLVDQSWIIDKIGTMFVMPAQELEEIQDPDKIRRIARKVPWKNWKPAEQGLMMTVQQAAQMMLDYGIPAHIRDRHVGNQNAPAGTSASMPPNDVANRPLALTAYPHQNSPQSEHHQQQKDLIDMSLEVFLQEINSSRTQPHSSTPLPTTGAGRSNIIGNNVTISQNGPSLTTNAARVRINDFGDEEPKLVKELKNAGISTINWVESPTVENITDDANKENFRNVRRENIGKMRAKMDNRKMMEQIKLAKRNKARNERLFKITVLDSMQSLLDDGEEDKKPASREQLEELKMEINAYASKLAYNISLEDFPRLVFLAFLGLPQIGERMAAFTKLFIEWSLLWNVYFEEEAAKVAMLQAIEEFAVKQEQFRRIVPNILHWLNQEEEFIDEAQILAWHKALSADSPLKEISKLTEFIQWPEEADEEPREEQSKSYYSDQDALSVVLIDPRAKLPVEEEIVNDSIREGPKSQNELVQTSFASAGIGTIQEQSELSDSDQDALNVVLGLCDNKNVISWYDFVSACSLDKCTKLGEGTYGEVYKVGKNGKETALKVIPFAIDQEQLNKIVNGDYLKPPTSTFNELLITRELSKLSIETQTALTGFVTPCFITLTQAAIVRGVYPEELLLAWDQFKELKPNLAENQRPSEYATEDQHFILFALANGGIDLESYKVRNQKECYSIFYQIAISLAIAEEALEFEHRDLHIGNILIDTCGEHEIIRFIYEGKSIDVHSCGVKVSIIDFTNSRMQKGDRTVYIDLSEDEGLFQGEGDYQFEIYRMMRGLNKNEWKGFTPKTNLLWLHYLSRKLFDIPRLFRKRRAPLLEMFDKLLQKERVKEFLADEELIEEFADYRA